MTINHYLDRKFDETLVEIKVSDFSIWQPWQTRDSLFPFSTKLTKGKTENMPKSRNLKHLRKSYFFSFLYFFSDSTRDFSINFHSPWYFLNDKWDDQSDFFKVISLFQSHISCWILLHKGKKNMLKIIMLFINWILVFFG